MVKLKDLIEAGVAEVQEGDDTCHVSQQNGAPPFPPSLPKSTPQYSSKSKRGVICGSGKTNCGDGVHFGILCWDIMFCTGR